MSDREFDELIRADAFLEWAEMFGHRSGTPAGPVDEARRQGRDVILEIDVQGARQIRDRIPDAVLVFLEPPTREELERRLRERGTESTEDYRRRVAAFDFELAQKEWFDHVVINDDLSRATDEVAAIIEAYR